MRREIEERPACHAEAVRQQRRMASMMAAQALDDHVRDCEDTGEESERESDREEGNDDCDSEDRKRRDYQKAEEHDGSDVDSAKRSAGHEACQRGVLLEGRSG